MKLSYAVNNLRSLSGLSSIELRPITILVGRNSAGKSTFLRSLPLLRQSVESRASAPILWYGRLVDYGDFQTAVRNKNIDESITFTFEAKDFEVRDNEANIYNNVYFSRPNQSRRKSKIGSARIEFEIGLQLSRTSKKKVNFTLDDNDISMQILVSKDGRRCDEVTVNGQSAKEILSGNQISFTNSALFCPIQFLRDPKSDKMMQYHFTPLEPFLSEIFKTIRPNVDKRIADHNLMFEALRILQMPRLTNNSIGSLIERTEVKSIKKLFKKWQDDKNQKDRATVDWLCAVNHAIVAYNKTCHALHDIFKDTNYIAPARASGERFYRFQELEVSEISPNGENLPMFLATLSQNELNSFSDWVEGIFGYGISVSKSVGHVSINLKRGDFLANVADTGYGVSQVLPILAQTWSANRRSSRTLSGRGSPAPSSLKLFAMEQPELHLHPAHQAKLADVFVEAYSQSTNPVHYLIETHSETLINRLGELIEEKKIPASAVQIIIFSSEEPTSGEEARISISTFDENGHLKSWPFGFFSY